MKIQFIGTGGAFAPIERGQSNMLFISDSGKKLLLDCGMTTPYKLAELGIGAGDLDAIYISHLHADHTGGMECVGFMTFFTGCKKPKLFAESNVMTDLWDFCLRGGMDSIQGVDADLSTFFDMQPINMRRDGHFEWENHIFRLVQTLHVTAFSRFQDSYGFLVWEKGDEDNKSFFTTDTQFQHPNPLDAMYNKSKWIFHDCETSPFKSNVHSHYDEINNGVNKSNKSKMVLYHHGPEIETWKDDGFKCFAKTFDTFDLKTGEKCDGVKQQYKLTMIPIELVDEYNSIAKKFESTKNKSTNKK